MRFRSIAGKVCYFAFIRESGEAERVRFGFSEREEAQIVTSHQNWRDLAMRLRADGCKLVETSGGARAREA